MRSPRDLLDSFDWLVALLILAIGSLVFQLVPALSEIVWSTGKVLLAWATSVIDVRHWTRGAWFTANLLFVLVLVAIRCAPAIKKWMASWRERQVRQVKHAATTDVDADHEARLRRDKEWCERAKRRLPFQ